MHKVVFTQDMGGVLFSGIAIMLCKNMGGAPNFLKGWGFLI